MDCLTSSGSLSTGTSAGLMRLTAASSSSGATVSLTLLSVILLRSSVNVICFAATKSFGITVWLKNSRTCSGMAVVTAGLGASTSSALAESNLAGGVVFFEDGDVFEAALGGDFFLDVAMT